MRAFISLNLNEKTIAILKDFQKRIKEDLGFTEAKKIKWESPDKFHVTMFFIGDISDDKAEDLKDDLKTIQKEKIGKLSLELGKLNGFPDLNRPKVLFAEVIDRVDKLNKLYGAINKIMKNYGCGQTGKFHPHITIGRVRRDFYLHKIVTTGLMEKNNFEIRNLHLMKSVLNREGSVHESIFSTEL